MLFGSSGVPQYLTMLINLNSLNYLNYILKISNLKLKANNNSSDDKKIEMLNT